MKATLAIFNELLGIIMLKFYFLIGLLSFSSAIFAGEHSNNKPETISTHSLKDFESNPKEVKQVIKIALDLANKNIGYRYGSAEPKSGGMDCSGTIHYLLTQVGIKTPPRSSEELYKWIVREGAFHQAKTNDSNTTFQELKPGDLLFWSGTYQTEKNVYVSHVMMYLGKNSQGEPLMVGSSNGRTYKGRSIYGVSVFDFQLPAANSRSKFLGYSCIPKVTC